MDSLTGSLVKLRPETTEVLDKLKVYDYACLWVMGIPKVTFSKNDGMYTIDRYITKYVPETDDWFVDGAYESDFNEEKIRN